MHALQCIGVSQLMHAHMATMYNHLDMHFEAEIPDFDAANTAELGCSGYVSTGEQHLA